MPICHIVPISRICPRPLPPELREVPDLGSAAGGHPDLFRFPRFLPICSAPCFRERPDFFLSGMPRFAPLSSDLFRFVFSTHQGNPLSDDHLKFCKSPTNFREVPPEAFPITRLAGRLSEVRVGGELFNFDWHSLKTLSIRIKNLRCSSLLTHWLVREKAFPH